MAKELKLQQERAVIPGRKPWTCGKDRNFGRERAARRAASTSGAEPDMTAKRAMNGGASNCLWPPFTWLLIGCLAPTILSVARTVIAEINPAMPRTYGESMVHLNRFDALVEVDVRVAEYLHPNIGEIAERVARYIASIIDDGSTLQIGLGRVPNEALRHLKDRRDLDIHSDVITDGVVDLVEAGVVTGRCKTRYRDRIVASYCVGTRRLYDFVDDNPGVQLLPIDQVCHPEEVARQSRMVSITQAFAVDLTGRCVDQFEGEFYGGVSTQVGFIRGAAHSPGGKPIICLSSTTDMAPRESNHC